MFRFCLDSDDRSPSNKCPFKKQPKHSAGCQIYEKAAEVRQKHEAEVAAVEKAKVRRASFSATKRRRYVCRCRIPRRPGC